MSALLILALVVPADITIPPPRKTEAEQPITPIADEDRLESERAAALEAHDKASQSRKRGDRAKALALYRAYLKKAGKDARDPDEIRFFIAELLHDDKRPIEAAAAFTEVMKLHPKSRFAVQAAWRAFLSAEEVLKKRRGRSHQQRLIDTSVAYVKLVDAELSKEDGYVEEDERASALWSSYEARKKLGDKAGIRLVLERLAADFADDVYGQNAIQLLNPPK